MAKKKEIFGKYGSAEGVVKNQVIDSEYKTAQSNNAQQYADYESILDMVELIRSEKHFAWDSMSDIFIGLLLSHMLTESASWAAQDFQSRDFVDIYLEGNQPDDKMKAKAAKTLLNCLLNIKDIYHFAKRIRGRTINWIFGQVYAVMWWEQEAVKRKKEQPPLSTVARDYDEQGNIVSKVVQIPQDPIEYEEVVKDRMNYDVFDARNVFTDFSYTYSAQQKPWITLRSEKRFSEIKDSAEQFGYFNIDILQDRIYGGDKKRKKGNLAETETSKETFNKLGGAYGSKTDFYSKIDPTLDVLDRYGKIWAVVEEKDDDGLPVKIKPGYNEVGELDDKAELVEAIVTHVGMGEDYTLIGFRPTWAIDAYGKPYKPIIRGWCYIHPTKDVGLSDGKNLREMNIAANDTFNISNVRTLLATLPVMKGRRDAVEGNPTVFFEPENLILLEDIDKDLKEIEIRDNIGGAMNQLAFIKATSSEMDAIWPTTMGGLPEKTSTTATAVAGAETRTSSRGNLKGLTFTYTFDIEFYQMILQMVYRNMKDETIKKILGEELYKYFDPKCDYTYVPLSQNLEQEHSKMKKVNVYDQMNGRLAGLAKIFPKEIASIIAFNTGKQAELMGSDFREIAHLLEALTKAKPQPQKGAESVKNGQGEPASNEQGIEQSTMEQDARMKNG